MIENQYRRPAQPPQGRVDSSALLCGGLGLLLSGLLYWLGLLGKGDLKILDLFGGAVFREVVPSVLDTPALVVITALCCFGLALAMLDSCGVWRKLVLGVTLMVLVLALVPTLAVWNIYFAPMMSLVGIFWTWFAGVIYASHYQMPCDIPVESVAVVESAVTGSEVFDEMPLAGPESVVASPEILDVLDEMPLGVAEVKEVEKIEVKQMSDVDAKYKPKE